LYKQNVNKEAQKSYYVFLAEMGAYMIYNNIGQILVFWTESKLATNSPKEIKSLKKVSRNSLQFRQIVVTLWEALMTFPTFLIKPRCGIDLVSVRV